MGFTNGVDISLYGRVPIDRLISGLLFVNVRHAGSEDDCIEEYYSHWGTPATGSITAFTDVVGKNHVTSASHGLSSGDDVVITGTTNYNGTWTITRIDANTFSIPTPWVADDATGTWTEINAGIPNQSAMDANPFRSTQPSDPKRTGYGLGLGDMESLLFYVSGGVHLDNPASGDYGTLYRDPVGYTYTSGDWYKSIVHSQCQSFLRSTLLARHCNSFGLPATFQKNAIYQREWTGNGLVAASRADTALLNNGVYNDDDGYFDVNLDYNNESKNTWFNPLYDVIIRAKHKLELTSNPYIGGGTDYGTLYQIATHPTTFWNIEIVLRFLNFLPIGDSYYDAFFRSRTNVFFQPFGETADIKFSTTEYTS